MKNGLALAVSLLLGVLGFAAMYVVLSRKAEQGGEGSDGSPKKRIVVARKALPTGTRLAASLLETRAVPAEFVSSAHIEESQVATLLGLSLRTPVKEGEPVLLPALESGKRSGAREIESQLQGADRLAISIDLDEAQSLAGLIEPGQKVDVIGTFDIEVKRIGGEGDGDDTVTRTSLLLQNRTVLAVDVTTHARYEGDPKQTTKHVVTLAVTAEEALKLALLQARGEAHLALRRSTDDRVEPMPAVGAEVLIGQKGGP